MDPAKIAQFNGLIQGVIGGRQHRHVFQPWELAILLDIESCTVRQCSREDLLRRYQRAAYQHAVAGEPELLAASAISPRLLRPLGYPRTRGSPDVGHNLSPS